MFEIKVEAQFKADYKRTMRIHPQLKTEFKAAVAELAAHGSLPAEYGAHELSNPGGNYNGHIDFHLSDGCPGCLPHILAADWHLFSGLFPDLFHALNFLCFCHRSFSFP